VGTDVQKTLFTPVQIGPITLKHRVVMPPMSRLRAQPGTGIPSDLQLEYYTQRASHGGLIITEATAIAASARGYYHAPGLYADEQVAGWKRITDAVHAKDAYFFTQLWHAGRTTHVSITGSQPITASVDPTYWADPGIVIDTPDGFRQTSPHRALETAEIAGVLEQYSAAAENAKKAGFDGVELMAANGHLMDQCDAESHGSDWSAGPMASQQLIERVRPLFRKEKPRSGQLDGRSRSWDRFGQPVRPFHRKVDVVRGPDDQCRSLELPQSGLDGQSVLIVECADETLQIVGTLRIAQVWPQVDFNIFVPDGFGVLVGWAKRTWRAVDRFVAEHSVEGFAQPAGSNHFHERFERFRRPVVMGIAIGERQGPDAIRIERGEDLANSSATVVSDQIDLIYVQRVEHVLQHLRVGGHRHVLSGCDFRVAVRKQVDRDAPPKI
jgi:hypothetical protein